MLRSSIVALLAALVFTQVVASAGAAASVEQRGYVAMDDGTQLAYDLVRPAAEGRFPVALIYDGYCEGSTVMTCNDAQLAQALLGAGYAMLGVSVRGTGCSGGVFDLREPRHDTDGARIVEWAAAQPWSTGSVGMVGDSFPGLTQPGVAALRPRGLKAIAPFQIADDIYRDVGYPGGIFNVEFAAFWGLGNQPAASYGMSLVGGSPRAGSAPDEQCVRNEAGHAAGEPSYNTFLQGVRHPFDDELYRSRRIGERARRIDVPVLGCTTWQDDEISSRNGSSWYDLLDPRWFWFVGSNGFHAQCDRSGTRVIDMTVRFMDRYVKGVANGWESTPHVTLWHETAKAADATPAWVTHHDRWPVRVRPARLYLRSGGRLDTRRPRTGEAPDSYAYPRPSAGTENGVVAGQGNRLWKVPQDPDGAVAFTTPPLTRDAVLFGTASLDLWLASTASDTDLQATITEVRPDGQEVYVQRGWLRASHRRLDPRRSTVLTPFHTHAESDARPLTPGTPARVRVELPMFNHVARAGSSLRVIVDAPTAKTGGWSLDYLKAPATNTILHDREHQSRLVVGLVAGERAGAPLPACDTLLNQPCRPDPFGVPGGSLTIRQRGRA